MRFERTRLWEVRAEDDEILKDEAFEDEDAEDEVKKHEVVGGRGWKG